MKKLILGMILSILCLLLSAQVPESFNYQVVVRDGSSNNPLVNQNVSFRMTILKGSSSGESQYSELHSANTGALGIVNLVIGNGTDKTGNFTTIDWGADTYFLNVQIDKGDAIFMNMGTTQLLSVPYAMYSKSTETYTETQTIADAAALGNSVNTQLKNLTDPTDAKDAATKKYTDDLINELLGRIETLEEIVANNEPVYQKRILITEIMANQAGTESGGAGEFIELINAGTTTVDLHNLWIAVGTQDAFVYDQLQSFQTGTTLLLPGAYAVILDPNYDDRYSFPTGTVLVTVGDAVIGFAGIATTHWITLYDVDRSTMLDEFQYPSDPGDGISLYRISLNADNNYANWAASPSGSTPGKSYSADACFVNTFTSFWVDHFVYNEGRFWIQAIGWPDWYNPAGSPDLVNADGVSTFTYRFNVPAPQAFEFKNPYSDYNIVFRERNSPTAVGDGSEAYVRVNPGVTVLIPASSLGYYYVCTEGSDINTLESIDWSNFDPIWLSFPQDGIIAPFFIEIQ